MKPSVQPAWFLALPLLALLGGCAVGPNYVPPETDTAGAFGNADASGLNNGDIEIRWWRSFGDPQLTQLVETAAAANFDVAVALTRIQEVRALRTESILDGLPIVTSGASYTNTRLSQAEAGEFADNNQREFEIYDVGFDATWELDFFGRVRRNIEANTALLGALIAERRDILVTVIAEVARNYLELRGLQEQVAIARRNAVVQKKTLDLTERLLEGGRGTELDTSRASAQYFTTLAAIPPLETAVKRAIHRIAVLTGQQPQALYGELLPVKPLPELPAIVNIGEPAELLRRRPDIRVAERDLASLTAEIGVATADYFPRVRFNGNVALQANVLSGIGSTGSDAFSFGPVISWAAFDLGRVEARVRQADSRAAGQLARYKLTVISALEETENALVDFTNEKVRLSRLREAATSSQKAASLASTQFDAGLTDFLNVLDAEFTALNTELSLAESRTLAATDLVEIYKVLGGGWEVFPIADPGNVDAAALGDDSEKPVTGPQPPADLDTSK
ncbi:MAG: efflux transporter outer membrane subunit [Verrucomicrobiota bacterium]